MSARPPSEPLIGIVGGMGPRAHLRLEACLLDAACRLCGAETDQDFPDWIVSSICRTPDRTRAIREAGPSPVPQIVESLRRLESAGAAFALVACLTSHAWLGEIAAQARIEILDLAGLTAERIAHEGTGGQVGILATSGALRAGVLQTALRANGLEPVTPLDLPGGRALQEEKVMGAIYGRFVFPGAADDGIKACGPGVLHRRLLADVVGEMNRQIGLSGVVAGCTEVGLAFAAETAIAGVPLYDPLAIGAEAAVRRAKSGTSTAKQAE